MVKYGMRDDAWIALGSHGSESPHSRGEGVGRVPYDPQRKGKGQGLGFYLLCFHDLP